MTTSLTQRWVFPNGLTFLYRQSAGLPMCAATLLLRSGSLYESEDQAGLASFTAELLVQGTRRRSARRIADEIESIGASLGAHASEDYSEVGLLAPVASLPRVLDVLTDVVRNPIFPPNEIEKERAQVLAALKSRQDGIFNVAYDAFNARLYASHPYGRPLDGTEHTVRRFKRQDFQSWHALHYRPERMIFSLVSPLSSSEARRRVAASLGAWKSSKDPAAVVVQPSRPLLQSAHARLTARFEQAYLMVGTRAPTVFEPDYAALKVLNTLFGGGMSSRLFLQLRENLGLAYEVSSFFSSHISPGQWVIYLGLPAQKVPVAKKALDRLLGDLERKEPRREEVRQAVAMMQGAQLMELQTRRRQAWYAAWWEFLGRSPKQHQDFLKAVGKVTPAQVRSVARRLLDQPRVTIEVMPKK